MTQLKETLTKAPILKHPDPTKTFIVDVDDSETRDGTEVQCSSCNLFFPHKLSPFNDDVELLAIKLTLKEWGNDNLQF